MSGISCVVSNCKITAYNKPPGVTFHSCPPHKDMRNKWHNILKNRCIDLDWSKSKICSKHFENKYFDSQRQLKDSAVPTLFQSVKTNAKTEILPKYKIDGILNGVSLLDLKADIKRSFGNIEVSPNVDKFYSDDLVCKPDAPTEAEMWLIIKKQEHLNTRLTQTVNESNRRIETIQKELDDATSAKNVMAQSVETYKYIIKCLQEKLTTLEEQVEILTAVESR